MRLLEVIRKSAEFLGERGVESPRLQVEWILARELGVPRLQLYLQFERELEGEVLDRIREAVRRRGRREPLQHVLGTAPFCGLEFESGPEALVPRPETEQLAERGWTWLEARARESGGEWQGRVLDWGTGTGCLAVTLAVRVPAIEVVGVDISPAAAALARRNVVRHGVGERVRVVESDGCAALAPTETFDLVVANPPYIPTGEIAGLAPEVRDHDPHLALDGGAEGLDLYRRLAGELSTRLRLGGVVLMEFGDGQAPALGALLAGAGWVVEEWHRDYGGRDRFLLARRSAANQAAAGLH